MHRIGLIGGLSWAASAEYYRVINQSVSAELGAPHSADLVLRSLDFAPILKLADDRSAVEALLYDAAQDLIAGGARCLALASFTGHSYAARIRGLAIPLIDLTDVIRSELLGRSIRRIGILATGRSLSDDVLLSQIDRSAMDIIRPASALQSEVDRIIFGELAAGHCSPETLEAVDAVADGLMRDGAEAILLATTEFSRIRTKLAHGDAMIDATALHCAAIVDWMLTGKEARS